MTSMFDLSARLSVGVVNTGAKAIARSFLIPWMVADAAGVSEEDMTVSAAQRFDNPALLDPARTLVNLDEDHIMSFLARLCVEFDGALSSHAEFKKLSPGEAENVKATVMMDFWLNVSRQMESTYFDARLQIRAIAAQLRELRDSAWHDNWKRRADARAR